MVILIGLRTTATLSLIRNINTNDTRVNYRVKTTTETIRSSHKLNTEGQFFHLLYILHIINNPSAPSFSSWKYVALRCAYNVNTAEQHVSTSYATPNKETPQYSLQVDFVKLGREEIPHVCQSPVKLWSAVWQRQDVHAATAGYDLDKRDRNISYSYENIHNRQDLIDLEF